MAVVTAAAPVELTDEQSASFLEALERTGSVRGSARQIGVNRQIAYQRRYRDPQFGAAWNAALSRRMRQASDDLFASIDELVKLTGGDWESAVDELVNVTFDETEKPPQRPSLDPERLATARERLSTAAGSWAAAVGQVKRRRLDREQCEREVAMLWGAKLTHEEIGELLSVSAWHVRVVARSLGLDMNDARRLGDRASERVA